jgi:hypothetical protein
LTLDASKATLRPGDTATLTATLSDSDATGDITFYEIGDGQVRPLGIVQLNAGTATLPVTFSTTGTHQVMAAYAGASGYAASTTQGALPIMIEK